MSTPISQGSKLEGFSLYALRRTREGLTPDCEAVTPPKSQEPQSDRMQEPENEMREPDDDWTQSNGGQHGSNEAEPDAVGGRLEHAIRQAIALGPTMTITRTLLLPGLRSTTRFRVLCR